MNDDFKRQRHMIDLHYHRCKEVCKSLNIVLQNIYQNLVLRNIKTNHPRGIEEHLYLIVTGWGSGDLAKAVDQYLRRNKYSYNSEVSIDRGRKRLAGKFLVRFKV